MRFKLYLELGTRAEDEAILELIRYPDCAVLDSMDWCAKWWSHGRTKRIRSTDREHVIKAVSRDSLNELDLRGASKKQAQSEVVTGVGVWTQLTLSPMNILWAPIPEGILANPHEDRKRRNHAMHESIKAGEFRSSYPSIVEYEIEIEFPERAEPTPSSASVVDFIRRGISPAMASLDLFGYACVNGDRRRALMTHNVAGRGGNIDQLGDKFDNIYPILIGPKGSCEGLAHSLRAGTLEPLAPSGSSKSFILSIPEEFTVPPGPRAPELLAPSASDPSVRRWLV